MNKHRYFAQKIIPVQFLEDLQKNSLKTYKDVIDDSLAKIILPGVKEKMVVKLVDRSRDYNSYHGDTCTFRAEVYILTEDELEELVRSRAEKMYDKRKANEYSKMYGRDFCY